MNDTDFVLVDSNVIIDIAQRDATWYEWSLEALETHPAAKVNPIIYTELCYQHTSPEEVDELLSQLEIGYQELSRDTLYHTSQAYREYRQRGGLKTAPLPDFFIGAHAAVLEVPLITRDVARYQTYFPSVQLICP